MRSSQPGPHMPSHQLLLGGQLGSGGLSPRLGQECPAQHHHHPVPRHRGES